MVTSDQFNQLKIDVSLADVFNETFDRFDISTPARQACWIGQCGHECGNFRIMEENLNYRAPTLLKLFPRTPKRAWGFTPEEAAALGEDFVMQPELVRTPKYAAMTAGWFWQTHRLNQYADSGDYLTMTKKINGGTIGLEDRKAHINHAIHVLS